MISGILKIHSDNGSDKDTNAERDMKENPN